MAGNLRWNAIRSIMPMYVRQCAISAHAGNAELVRGGYAASGSRASIAGIWRETKEVGEAFKMLTMEPGPDVAPYHDRQIVILERDVWAGWLDPSVPAQSLIRPLPAGSLLVQQVG